MGPAAWDLSPARVLWHATLLEEDLLEAQARAAEAAMMSQCTKEDAWRDWIAARVG